MKQHSLVPNGSIVHVRGVGLFYVHKEVSKELPEGIHASGYAYHVVNLEANSQFVAFSDTVTLCTDLREIVRANKLIETLRDLRAFAILKTKFVIP